MAKNDQMPGAGLGPKDGPKDGAKSKDEPKVVERNPQVGVDLSDAQTKAQQTAPGREPEPKPKPLTVPKGDDSDRPPEAPVAKAAPCPRLVHANERAPHGLKRFRVRAVNLGPQPVRYVLAGSKEEAERHYIKATGIDAVTDMLGEDFEARLSTRELPD